MNGTMANSSKKRKASELEPDHSNTPSKRKSRRRSKGSKNDGKSAEDIPFKTECPYRSTSRANDDVYVQKEEVEPGFEVEFAVRPGVRWNSMRSYRNVKLQDHTFSVGATIYINKQSPPPKSPPPDATDAEVLQYDRNNFWVGKIMDTRAETDKAVFLRVYWLYWPEELPMGRQPYHGDRELVLSNAMDIVDAQTISGAADLAHWDERDTNHLSRDRFWRQTFDISRLGKDKKGGLSELRKHCICQQPHNPDRIMFQCKKASCLTWNHEECLIKDALQRAWPVYSKDGTLESLEIRNKIGGVKFEGNEGEGSVGHGLLTPMRQLGKIVQNKIAPSVNLIAEQALAHSVGSVENGTPRSSKKSKMPKKTARPTTPANQPWEDKLQVQIVNTDEKDDDSPIIARMEEVSHKKLRSEPRSWPIQVNCLMCGDMMH